MWDSLSFRWTGVTINTYVLAFKPKILWCFNFKGFSGQQTPLIFETNEVTVETLSLARTQEDQHECAAAQIDLKKKEDERVTFKDCLNTT